MGKNDMTTLVIMTEAQKRIRKDINSLELEVDLGVNDLVTLSVQEEVDGEGIVLLDRNQVMAKQVTEQCLKLTINGVDDTEGIEKVTRAKGLVRNMRLTVDRWHKNVKAEPLAVCQALDEYRRTIVPNVLEPAEKALESKLLQVQNLKEQELAKQQLAIQERFKARYAGLMKMGMTYNGIDHRFELGEASVTEDIVRLSDDDALRKVLTDHVMPEVTRIANERKRIAEQQAAAQLLLQKQQLADQAKSKEQHEEQARLAELNESEAEQLRVLRASVLETAGMKRNGMTLYLGMVTIGYPSLNEYTEDVFSAKVEEVKAEIERLRSIASNLSFASSEPMVEIPSNAIRNLEGNVIDYASDRAKVMGIAERLAFVLEEMKEGNFTSDIAKATMRQMRERVQYVTNYVKGTIKDL